MKKHVFWLVLAVPIALVIGCQSCKPGKAEPKAPAPVSEKKISKINFFMETSGSMAGYLQGATDFRKRIPNLLVSIEDNIDNGKVPVHSFYISDSIQPFNGNTQEFINEISTKRPTNGKSSEMHKLFEMIALHTDSNDISIFVSDCILSYSDDKLKIKGNQNINRDNAEGELKSTMTRAFNQLQRKGICASVYGFNSSFIGNYYTYQNKIIPLNGDVPRPYYMWVIGSRDLLIRFNKQLLETGSLEPHTIAMDFGLFDQAVTKGDILYNYRREGDWAVQEDGGLEDVVASAKKPCVFSVSVDLSSLPEYAQSPKYISTHLHPRMENGNLTIEKIELASKVDRNKLENDEQKLVNASTHVLVLRVKDIYQSGDVKLSMPFDFDTSYTALSVMDDRTPAAIAGKTFALQHLIDGVTAAYGNTAKYYVNISIPLKK